MRRARGFTLVKAALVLVTLGLALAVAVPLLTSYTKMTRARATRGNLRSLRESLLGYLLARGPEEVALGDPRLAGLDVVAADQARPGEVLPGLNPLGELLYPVAVPIAHARPHARG